MEFCIFPLNIYRFSEKYPKGRLTRLIKCTTGEAQELVKHFINDKQEQEQDYKNAVVMLRRQSS